MYRIGGREHTIGLADRPISKPIPGTPTDIERNENFEYGVAPHGTSVAQSAGRFREPRRQALRGEIEPQEGSIRRKYQVPGFCAQTLHQPPAGTVWPTKILHAALASVGFPWYCAQLAHF